MSPVCDTALELLFGIPWSPSEFVKLRPVPRGTETGSRHGGGGQQEQATAVGRDHRSVLPASRGARCAADRGHDATHSTAATSSDEAISVMRQSTGFVLWVWR